MSLEDSKTRVVKIKMPSFKFKEVEVELTENKNIVCLREEVCGVFPGWYSVSTKNVLEDGPFSTFEEVVKILKCPHCEFLEKTFDGIKTNREYWLYTEMFVYLHNGKDWCDFSEEKV